jgi:hypothetical protein
MTNAIEPTRSAGALARPSVRGVDRGFCFSYWRLSYRRKFLRTLMLAPMGWVLAAFPPVLGLPGWVVAIAVSAMGGLQAAYNYVQWRREEQRLGLPPAPLV